MLLFLRYAPYVVAGLFIIAILWTVNHWRVEASKVPVLEQNIDAQEELLKTERQQCQTNKEISEEVSNEYQSSLDAVNKRLNGLLRKPKTCITVSASSKAGRPDGKASGNLNAGQAGVDPDVLYFFAADAERYRLQVIALQTFVNAVWENNNALDKKTTQK